jgi:ubiquinone/menaquinone biosynthesis C-methylase UbiE
MNELLWEIHSGLPREGPGNDAATEHVASSLPGGPRPRILDIGCGPGMQTLCLARCFDGDIVAVDNHQPYLETLHRRAKAAGLDARIVTVDASMDALPFGDESFDLIWSEGAIYCMGFDAGLAAWRRLLAPDGILVVSELTWLADDAPDEAKRFWDRNYPAMRNVAENVEAVTNAGYRLMSTYVLPAAAWFTDYYDPLERRLDDLCLKYASDDGARGALAGEREEISLFRRFGNAYGYVFYAMQRP